VALVRKIWERLDSDDCADLAAQLSFYFVLSLSPFFLVLTSRLGWIPTADRWDAFADWLTTFSPDERRRAVLASLLALSHGYASFLSIGLLATVWSASSGFLNLMEALSIAYGIKDGRSYFKNPLIATVTTLVAAVFALGFALWNFSHVVNGLIITDFHYFVLLQTQWRMARWIATLVLLFLGIALINCFLPAEWRSWRWFSPGTVFVVLAFGVAALGFTFYVAHGFNIPKIYGVVAGLIVLVLWIYAANLMLLIGAETDTALRERRPHEAGA
jgi:membrane protein